MIHGRPEREPDDDLDFGWLRDRLDNPLALPVFLFGVTSLLLFWAVPPVSDSLSEVPTGTWGALGLFALCAGLVAALAARSLGRGTPLRWQSVTVGVLSLVGIAAGGWAVARGAVGLFGRIGGLDLAFAAATGASFATGLLLLELAWPGPGSSSGEEPGGPEQPG